MDESLKGLLSRADKGKIMLARRTVLLSFLVSILIGSFALVSPVLGQSPSDVYITPSSGTPGTVVTLVNNNKDFSFQCSAGGAGLGTVSPGGTLTYGVPSDAAVGSLIDFRCFITNVDTSDTVGVFAVTAPEPPLVVDSDGDGLPDDVDKCPKEAANTQNGCPAPAPQQPQPPDQPQQPPPPPPGPPAPNAPVAPVGPTSVPVVRPQLLTTGPCVVATAGGTGVNIRQGPSTDETIVGTLNPARTYPVTVRTADGAWYQIEGGWVAARVTRTGGDCSSVPVLSFQLDSAGAPTPTPMTIMIAHEAPWHYDLGSLLEQCPALVNAARVLNFQQFIQLVMVSDGAQRCASAYALIRHRTFLPGASDLTPYQIASSACDEGIGREAAAAYNAFVRTLLQIDPDLLRTRFSNANPADNFSVTWGWENRCDIFRLNRPRMAELGSARGLPSNELVTIAVASCPRTNSLSAEHVRITVIQLIQAGFVGADLLRDPDVCAIIDEVHRLGTLSFNQLSLFSGLVQICHFTHYHQSIPTYDGGADLDLSAARLVSLSDRLQSDLNRFWGGGICHDPLGAIEGYGHDNSQQQAAAASETSLAYYTPVVFQTCLVNFRDLERHGSDISPAELLSILLSHDPCLVANHWLRDRTPIPLLLGAARLCITGQTVAAAVPASTSGTGGAGAARPSTVTYGGVLPSTADAPFGSIVYRNGRIVSVHNEFRTKLYAVDKAVNSICDQTEVSGAPQAIEAEPTPFLALSDPSLTAIDINTLLSAGILFATTPAATAEIGAPPLLTPEVTVDIGEPPRLPAATMTPIPFHVVTSTPSTGATPVVSGVSSPIPSDGSTAVPSIVVSRVPATNVPSVGTAVAMLPPSADMVADAHIALDALAVEARANGASGIIGAFQAAASDTAPADLYLLTTDGIKPLLIDTPQSEALPALDANAVRVAFIQTDTTGQTSLQMVDLTIRVESVLLASTPELRVESYAPAWTPDGLLLLVTLADYNGRDGIYSLDMSDPSAIPAPTLLVPDAVAPAITSDGHFIAYAQGSASRRDIVVMELSSGRTLPITDQPDGSQCVSSSFDQTGLTLYFSCIQAGNTELYGYDLNGLKQIPDAITSVGDIVAGPTVNALTLSDGASIYVLDLAASDERTHEAATTQLITLENLRVSNLRWRMQNPDDGG